jgi:hypothetical protein
MKYLQTFENYSQGMSQQAMKFLERCVRGRWSHNTENGKIDIYGNFICQGQVGENISNFYGINFGRVLGDFICVGSGLTNLVGCPTFVDGNFDCSNNLLTSLSGGPEYINGDYNCSGNNILDHQNLPKFVAGDVITDDENLRSKIKLQSRKTLINRNISYDPITKSEGDGLTTSQRAGKIKDMFPYGVKGGIKDTTLTKTYGQTREERERNILSKFTRK